MVRNASVSIGVQISFQMLISSIFDMYTKVELLDHVTSSFKFLNNLHTILEKAREFQKNMYFCFIHYTKAFVWISTNCGKFWKRWEYQTTWLASWEICMHVSKQQLELDMEQQTGSKWEKEYIKAVYCHPAY